MKASSDRVTLYKDTFTTKELFIRLWNNLVQRWWFRLGLLIVGPIVFLAPGFPLMYFGFRSDPEWGSLGYWLLGLPIFNCIIWIVGVAAFSGLRGVCRWVFNKKGFSYYD